MTTIDESLESLKDKLIATLERENFHLEAERKRLHEKCKELSADYALTVLSLAAKKDELNEARKVLFYYGDGDEWDWGIKAREFLEKNK